MEKIKKRYSDKFYLHYLLYTALETDLLFWIVIDVTFMLTVKSLPADKVSLITALSLGFSIIIQYPFLKIINRIGNRAAVRTGSILFLLSAMCFIMAPGFILMLIGGFLKCIAHTLNSMGTALLKNRLIHDNKTQLFVEYQSDANCAASLLMMMTAMICGQLYRINVYLPMVACVLLCITGVVISFIMSGEDGSSDEILASKKAAKEIKNNNPISISDVLMLLSFGAFTALTGTGLSYVKMNIQFALSHEEPGYVVTLLSVISVLVYCFRIISNMVMKQKYKKVRDFVAFIVSALLIAGLLVQTVIWHVDFIYIAVVLSIGYLLVAFVRDPYITLVQNISLESNDLKRQQSMLIALNGAKKTGALVLSSAATFLLKHSDISTVMKMMLVISIANFILCLWLYQSRKNESLR